MDDKPESKPEQERISELEAEVARLRQRLGDQEAADVAPSGNGASTAGASAEGRIGGGATRSRMVAVGLIVLVAALAIFSVVFFVLSRGFSSFAHKAAQVIMPGSGSGQGSSAAPSPPPEREGVPRAPGL
jgi:hypothetical protein